MGDDGEGPILKALLVTTVTSLVNVGIMARNKLDVLRKRPQASKEASYRLVDLVYPLVLECLAPQAGRFCS